MALVSLLFSLAGLIQKDAVLLIGIRHGDVPKFVAVEFARTQPIRCGVRVSKSLSAESGGVVVIEKHGVYLSLVSDNEVRQIIVVQVCDSDTV